MASTNLVPGVKLSNGQRAKGLFKYRIAHLDIRYLVKSELFVRTTGSPVQLVGNAMGRKHDLNVVHNGRSGYNSSQWLKSNVWAVVCRSFLHRGVAYAHA